MITVPALQKMAFGLTILQNGHPDIRRLRKKTGVPSIHGNKFWKSTYLLMDYLGGAPPPASARILEVGCGWGLAGIFCAKAFSAQVTSLDADDAVFPYLLHHADINGVNIETWKCRYENIRTVDLQQFDVMIAADICFWDSMVNPLFNLARRAHKAGVRVVMTDPGRPTFSAMADRCVDKLNASCESWSTPYPVNASGLVLDID
ncbi:MAG: putative nicotinamide N-methyase [Lentisphaeria bacterium]